MDRWLWAVRVGKNRSATTALCRGGHVSVNGVAAKAATPVRVGDRVEADVSGRVRVLEVVQVIDKRVAAAVADGCLVDHSPPPSPGNGSSPSWPGTQAPAGPPSVSAAASTASRAADRDR